MKHWQLLSTDDRLDVLAITSAKTHLPQLAVEKDWWVTMVLRALSTTRHFDLMSFKGGTSIMNRIAPQPYHSYLRTL